MEIGLAIAAKVAEYLVKPTINQVRYLFCFNSFVEDLEKEEADLKSAKDNVEKDVEIAERNTQKVKEDVSKWLKNASNVLADVQGLKEEIDSNKTCLNGRCPNWCSRYWLSRKAAKKASMMLNLVRDSGKFSNVAHPIALQQASGFLAPQDFEFSQSSKVAFDQIIEALKNDETNMVGLYGMGGAGKTTLANAVGHNVKQKEIFDEVVTAVVSQTPNFKNMQDVLVDKLGLEPEEKTEEGIAERLYLRFTGTKKILVILDDVWEKFDLKSKIGFPFGEYNKGCKILLTTRKQHLCAVMGCQSQIPLGLLNDDEALALLKRHAGRIDDDSFTWNELAIKVADECKGLPLAIATIGSALKGKGDDEWKVVSRKLKESKLVDIHNVVDVDKDVYAILKFSYDYLKGEKIKFCFLLCSLFPEDSEIPLEKLVRYGMGLGLFSDAEPIEDARIALRAMVNNLKASFLLLEANDDEHAKMHDMVRDVALWIASQGRSIFMVKTGMGLTEWPNENLEHCFAISLMNNNIEVLPNRLSCPALEILLLEGVYRRTKVSDQFFEEVRGLKVLNLSYCDLSLKSLQVLTNLKTLELISCNLRDFSHLVNLNKLEILSFQGSSFNELPRELGELGKLRLLDLRKCDELERIPSNMIRRCSQLEELRITSFKNWEVKETSTDQTSNASLFELNSLSRLAKLDLCIDPTCLPKDFAFRNLERYVISMNTDNDESYPRALSVSKIEASSLSAFRSLYQNLEYFYLNETSGCQNILPSIDQGGLKELKSLELRRCSDLKFIVDTSQQHLPAIALSSLETIVVSKCPNMCTLFPTELFPGLRKLKEVEISACDQLQEVFQFQHTGEENDLVLLPSLSKLNLTSLPKLSYIWKGSTNHVNLKTLTHLHIVSCEILEYIFPISIAQGLVGLEELIIEDAPQLKHVFHMDQESEEIEVERDGKGIVLPKLRKLTLGRLASLTSFLPNHYYLSCRSLEELKIFGCSSLTEIKIQDLNGKLRDLQIEDCHHELCDGLVLTCLRHHSKSLEKLRIKGCGVKVAFPLDGLVTAVDGQHELLFPNFKELFIEDCGELEQIIVEEDHMQPPSFPNLSRINVERCNKLKHVFPISIAQSLQKLQYITLEDNSQLEVIFGSKDRADIMDDKELILPQLEEVSLKALPIFSNICTSGYHFILKLRVLEIEDCHHELVLTCLRHHSRSLEKLRIKGSGVKVAFPLDGLVTAVDGQHELLFPNLKELSIEACGELEQIIVEKDHMQPLSFPSLSRIKVKSCNKLKQLFPITKVQSLQKLQYITLEDNSQLEVIFGCKDRADIMDDKELVLPQLKGVSLKALPSFSNFCTSGYHFILKLQRLVIKGFHDEDRVRDGIFTHLRDVKELIISDCGVKELGGLWKDPTHILSLQNLILLEVVNCRQLRHIFSSTSVAQNLLKLETLYVCYRGELEKIIVEEDDIQPLLFPNLRMIRAWRCKKLKRVFPVTIARGLQQLEKLVVGDNDELKEVFGERDGGKVMEMDDKAIALPRLRILKLKKLPRLSNFCPVGYHFIFPSLKEGELVVRECGMIATRFWLDENESVHAEAKPPKEGAKDDKGAQLPPHHPPLDIKWDSYFDGLHSLRTKLLQQGITPSSRGE